MKVAIVGLGVMGGSLARALRDRDGVDVVGWTVDAADRRAAAAAGVELGADLADAVTDADLLVVATPLSALVELAPALAGTMRTDAVVTDVASLQVPALRAAREANLGSRWVSAHPMAGSERSGFAASRPDLYDGVPVFLAAERGVPSAVRGRVETFWREAGAVPAWMDAADHDERMSAASHLPQVVATALADSMAAAGLSVESLGPGGRDATRLAGSSVTMWRDLLAHTRPSLIAALRDVARRLEEDAAALERGDTDTPAARLGRAGAWRSGS